TALAALHLDRPIAAWAMQKFVIRDQSARRTLGGGMVLDPLPPARQNNAARLVRLDALRASDTATAFTRLLAGSARGFDFDTFVRSRNLTDPECEALLAVNPVKICHDGNATIALHAPHWNALCDQIVEVLSAHHRTNPELLGRDETGVQTAIRPLVAKSLLRRAVAELFEAGVLGRRGIVIHLSGHRARPTPAEAALWKRVEPALAASGVRPPRVRELVDVIGVALDRLESFLARAEELGWVHRVAENRYFLPV